MSTKRDLELYNGLLTRLERARAIAVFLSEAKAKPRGSDCEGDGVHVERAAEILLYDLIQESLQLVAKWERCAKSPQRRK